MPGRRPCPPRRAWRRSAPTARPSRGRRGGPPLPPLFSGARSSSRRAPPEPPDPPADRLDVDRGEVLLFLVARRVPETGVGVQGLPVSVEGHRPVFVLQQF